MGDEEKDKRNFILRENGQETSVYKGSTPRQAALKAARDLDADPTESQAEQNKQTIRLRERGTKKVHVYKAWAWTEEAPDDPEWLEGQITEANVSKQGVTHID